MKLLNGYDYGVLAAYMALLVFIGVYFARYMKGAMDYFKAANKLVWWVAGLSSFMTSFSVWMFTGCAGIAYREGLSGAVAIGLPGLAIFMGFLLFAGRWRRSRVTTIMGYIEERYNLPMHQVASWSYVPVYLLYSGTALYALGIFISTALKIDIVLVILVSGIVILIYTLLGGLWAVTVADTIQSLVLLVVCLLLVPLSLAAAGGIGGLVRAAPADYFRFPSEGLPWHYFLAYLIVLIHGQNTNPIAQRYFSVRDEREARRVSLLCSSLFFVGILFWAIPPMAARILYPDLGTMLELPNPDEGAFVVIALRLLPHGLMGLLVSAMFAATMSSLASIFNLLSGIIAKDIFQRLFRRSVGDRGLLIVGRLSTLAIAVLVIGFSLLIVGYGIGAFQVMMKVSSLTITPLATPMLLGFLFRRPPGWAGLVSFGASVATACVFAFHLPLVAFLQSRGPWVDFSVSVFTIVSVGVAAFFLSGVIFRSSEAERGRIDKFFEKLRTPVDVAREIEASEIDRTSVAAFIGTIALVIGGLVTLFVLIPASVGDRSINLGVGIVFLAVGWRLLRLGRRGAVASG